MGVPPPGVPGKGEVERPLNLSDGRGVFLLSMKDQTSQPVVAVGLTQMACTPDLDANLANQVKLAEQPVPVT